MNRHRFTTSARLAVCWILSLGFLGIEAVGQDETSAVPFAQVRTAVRRAIADKNYAQALTAVEAATGIAPAEQLALQQLRIKILLGSEQWNSTAEAVQACIPLVIPTYQPAYETLHLALADGSPAEDSVIFDQCLDQIARHRRGNKPNLLLPLLWHAAELRPKDWRVMLALSEAYGVKSLLFDPEFAALQLTQLRMAVGEDDRSPEWLRLLEFLDKPAATLSPSDFKAKLTIYRQRLEDNLPGRLSDEPAQDDRLIGLNTRFRDLRDRGEQTKALEIVIKLRDLYPKDASIYYLLGQVACSLGPEYRPTLARQSLRKFLSMTGPGHFEATGSSPESLLEVLNRDAHPGDRVESITQARQKVLQWLKALVRKQKLLLAPDHKAAKRLEATWQRKQQKRGQQISANEVKAQELKTKLKTQEAKERTLRSRRRGPSHRRSRRPFPRGFDGREDLQKIIEEIAKTKRSIKRVERTIKGDRKELKKVNDKLNPLQIWLEQLKR